MHTFSEISYTELMQVNGGTDVFDRVSQVSTTIGVVSHYIQKAPLPPQVKFGAAIVEGVSIGVAAGAQIFSD